jgi:hypothetical protein
MTSLNTFQVSPQASQLAKLTFGPNLTLSLLYLVSFIRPARRPFLESYQPDSVSSHILANTSVRHTPAKTMTGPSGSSNAESSRKKRVLPPRPRRGGTGVGNCDADVLILDTRERQGKLRPLFLSSMFY